MSILLWIVFGGLTGWLASIIMDTDASQGLIANIVVGIIGAVLGGWLMNISGSTAISGFNLYSFIVAIFGAILLLTIVSFLKRLLY